MKLVTAPSAYSSCHKSRWQNISASTAARSQHRSNHPRRARTYLLRPGTARLLWTSLALFGLFVTLITVLLIFSIQLTLATLLVFAKIARTNGLTGQRAAIGDTSRTVKLQKYTRRCYLSAEILTGTTQRWNQVLYLCSPPGLPSQARMQQFLLISCTTIRPKTSDNSSLNAHNRRQIPGQQMPFLAFISRVKKLPALRAEINSRRITRVR
jgi:hypothetical protein